MPLDHTNADHKFTIALLALFVVPISGLSTDIYVPSLPAVSHYFHVNNSLTQLTITAFMLGIGLMQLFAGGVVDSFGRKKPFVVSMLIYVIATFLISFSPNIYQLIFLRFVQGVSIAVTVVAMRSVIPDLFDGKEFYKMMNYMTIAWSIGPIIAPGIGGYLQHYYGWKANFYFLSIYGLLGLAVILMYMPETSRYKHEFNIKSLIKRYGEYLVSWEYSRGIAINGLLYSVVILFSVIGPFLIQGVLGHTAVQFGYAALCIGFAWFLGSITNRFTINIPNNRKMKFCFWTMLIVAFGMLALALTFSMSIAIIVIPLFFLTWLGGTVFPNNFARAISLFPNTSGSANALFSGLLFICIALSSACGALLKSTNQIPIVIAYIVLISACLVLYYIRVPAEVIHGKLNQE